MGDYGLKAKPGRDIVIVIIVFAIISVLSVVLRIQSRRMPNLSLAFDDYIIIVAMVSRTHPWILGIFVCITYHFLGFYHCQCNSSHNKCVQAPPNHRSAY